MKVGIIGFGRIGKIHFDNIKQLTVVTQISICDPKSHDLDSSVEQFTNWKDLIDTVTPDAIIICTPTPTHFDILNYCCDMNIDVFCEKPVDLDIEKVTKINALATKSGIICQVGFNRRFDPDFAYLKERINNGDIGQVHQITITSRDPGLPSLSYIASSGGMLMDMTIHDFDMFRFLSDAEVKSVYTSASIKIDERLKEYSDVDTATTLLSATNGITCTIINSRSAAYGYDQRIEVFGSEGMLSVDNNHEHGTKLWTSNGATSSKPQNFFLERYAKSYKHEIAAFFDCIASKKDVPININDALKATQIARMAMESIETGQVVYI